MMVAVSVNVGGETVVTEIEARDYGCIEVARCDVLRRITDNQRIGVAIMDCGRRRSGDRTGKQHGEVRLRPSMFFPDVQWIRQFMPQCGGTTSGCKLDKPVCWANTLNGTHITVTVNGTPVEFADIFAVVGSSMTLVLSKPINVDGQEVVITITDAGAAGIKGDR